MSYFVSLENKDFDLNSLFNISHSYEVLKHLIFTLVSTNKNLSYKLADVNEEMKHKDELIKDLFIEVKTVKEHNKKSVEIGQNNINLINENLANLSELVLNLTKATQKSDNNEENQELLKLNQELIKKIEDDKSKLNPSRIRNSILELANVLHDSHEDFRENSENKYDDWLISFNQKKEKEKKNMEKKRKEQEENEKKRLHNKNNSSIKNNPIINPKDEKMATKSSFKKESYVNTHTNNSDEKNDRKSKITKNTNTKLSKISLVSEGKVKEEDAKNLSNKSSVKSNNNENENIEEYDNFTNLNNYNNTGNQFGNQNYQNQGSELAINRLERVINVLDQRLKNIERIDLSNLPKNRESIKNTNIINNIEEPKMKYTDMFKKIEVDNTSGLDELREKIMNLEIRINSSDDKLEELTIKCQDLDIYESLKSGGDNPNLDQSLILVQTLEKKIFKKFEFWDDKQKKTEEEQLRIKNDLTKNAKHTDELSGNVNAINSAIEDIIKKLNSKKMKSMDGTNQGELSVDALDEKLDEFRSNIEKKVIELIDNKNYSENDFEKLKPFFSNLMEDKTIESQNRNDAELSKNIKEVNKKITELDKQQKIMSNTINIEKVNAELLKLNEGLQRKINLEDFSDLKSNTNLISHQVTYLKETLSQVVDDRKVLEDIAWLRKKVENLTNSMLAFKSNDDITNSGSKVSGGANIDASKFLDASVFNAFHKNYVKDMEFLKQLADDNRNNIDSVEEKLRLRVSDTDMKNLEEYLINRIEK